MGSRPHFLIRHRHFVPHSGEKTYFIQIGKNKTSTSPIRHISTSSLQHWSENSSAKVIDF